MDNSYLHQSQEDAADFQKMSTLKSLYHNFDMTLVIRTTLFSVTMNAGVHQ